MTFTTEEIILIDKVNRGIENFDLLDPLYDRLYEYFLPEMPYGTAKARTGDPYEWIVNHLGDLLTNTVDIKPEDIKIDTYHVGSPWVHEITVRITHLPSGTIAESKDGRSQHQNRAIAMGLLKAKLLRINLEVS